MEVEAVRAAYESLQVELDDTKSSLESFSRTLQDSFSQAPTHDGPSKMFENMGGQELTQVLQQNLHAANATVKHLGLELVLRDREIAELKRQVGQGLSKSRDSNAGHSLPALPPQTGSDSLRMARMEMYCANLSSRCGQLEHMFHQLKHYESSKGAPHDAPSQVTPQPREYSVTVTSPSRHSSAASILAAETGLSDGIGGVLATAGTPGSPQHSKPPPKGDGLMEGRRSSGDWRIGVQASSSPQGAVRRQSSTAGPSQLNPEHVHRPRQSQEDPASSGQLAAAVRKIAQLEDELEEVHEQNVALLQQVQAVKEEQAGITALHAAMQSEASEISKLHEQVQDVQQALAGSQTDCQGAIARLAASTARHFTYEAQIHELERACSRSQAEVATLSALRAHSEAACTAAEQQVAELLAQAQSVSADAAEEIQGSRVAAAGILQVLAGICQEGGDGPQSISSILQHPNKQSLRGLLTIAQSLAAEAAAVMQQYQWAATDGHEDMSVRLARFSSVEARTAGMEEDLSAVLADISQLHSQLLAAEHANTELLAKQGLDPGRERDFSETIHRLEHQLKASTASMQDSEGQLAKAEGVREQLQGRADAAEAACADYAAQLAAAQTQLEAAQARCRELEAHPHGGDDADGESSSGLRAAHLQARLDTATQWGCVLEARCTELGEEVAWLRRQVVDQAAEVQHVRGQLAEAQATLHASQLALHELQGRASYAGSAASDGSVQRTSEGQSAGADFQQGQAGEPEAHLLREQLQAATELIARLQQSLRARGRAPEVSSPTIAAQLSGARRSAGEVLQGVASDIERRLRSQKHQGDGTDTGAGSRRSEEGCSHEASTPQRRSTASQSQGERLPLGRSSSRVEDDSLSEMSELSEAESRPGSSLDQEASHHSSLQQASAQGSFTFSSPPTLNPLFSEPSWLAQDRSTDATVQPQHDSDLKSHAEAFANDAAVPASPGSHHQPSSSLSSLGSSTSAGSLYVTARAHFGEHFSGDGPADDDGDGDGLAMQGDQEEAQDEAQISWTVHAINPAAFGAANPLFGQSSTDIFRSRDWAFMLSDRQEQHPDSFQPLPCPTNPLFGRSEAELTRSGNWVMEEITDEDQGPSAQQRPNRERTAAPSRFSQAVHASRWNEVVDDSSSDASFPVPQQQVRAESESQDGEDQSPSHVDHGDHLAAHLEAAREEASRLRAQVAALSQQCHEAGQAMQDMHSSMCDTIQRCSEAEAKLQALEELAQAAAADRDTAQQECERLTEQQEARDAADSSAAQQLAALQVHCRKLESELQAVQDFYARMEEDKRVLQQRCARLEEALSVANEPLNAAHTEVDTLNAQCQQLKRALVEAEQRLQDAATVGSAMQERFLGAEKEAAEARAACQELEAVLDEARQQAASLPDLQGVLAGKEEALQLAKQDAEAALAEHQRSAEAAATHRVQALQQALAEKEGALQQAQEASQEATAACAELQHAAGELAQQLEAAQQALAEREQALTAAQQGCQEAREGCEQQQQWAEDLSQQLQAAQGALADKESALQQAQQECTKAQAALHEYEHTIGDLSQQLQAAQEAARVAEAHTSAEHTAQQQELHESLAASEEQRRQLEQQYADVQGLCQDLEHRLRAAQADADQLRQAAQHAHGEKQDLSAQLQEAQSELHALAALLQQSLAERHHAEGGDGHSHELNAQVFQGHQQLEELKQHLAGVFEERSAAQAALQEARASEAGAHRQLQDSQAQLQQMSQHMEMVIAEHGDLAAQLGKADIHSTDLSEDLLAAQEQIQELTEQLNAAIQEIQDRQGELRRVGDQAANLADELAQSQHQAQLEQQHASDLQSDSISGKLHLMQEVERLTKECGKAQAEAARLHTALAEAQQGRGQADAQQGPGAVGQEGGREPLPEASAQGGNGVTQPQRVQSSEPGPLQRLAESELDSSVEALASTIRPRGTQPRASLEDLAEKLPTITKTISSRGSIAWGEDFLWSAIEAEDDRALLRLLDKRCAELAGQRARDVTEIAELSARVVELQQDLDACLETIEQERADRSSLKDAPGSHPVSSMSARAPSGSRSSAVGVTDGSKGFAGLPVPNRSTSNARLSLTSQASASRLSPALSHRASSLTAFDTEEEIEKLRVLATRLQAQLQARDAKIRSLKAEVASRAGESSLSSTATSSSATVALHSVKAKWGSTGSTRPAAPSQPLSRSQTAQPSALHAGSSGTPLQAPSQPADTLQQRARADAAEARATEMQSELYSVRSHLQAVQKAAGNQIRGLQRDLQQEQATRQGSQDAGHLIPDEQTRTAQIRRSLLLAGDDTDTSDEAVPPSAGNSSLQPIKTASSRPKLAMPPHRTLSHTRSATSPMIRAGMPEGRPRSTSQGSAPLQGGASGTRLASQHSAPAPALKLQALVAARRSSKLQGARVSIGGATAAEREAK